MPSGLNTMPLTQIAVHPSDNVPQSGKLTKKPQPTPIKKKDSAKVKRGDSKVGDPEVGDPKGGLKRGDPKGGKGHISKSNRNINILKVAYLGIEYHIHNDVVCSPELRLL